MRKIALIMDGWKRFFTYAWPAGILERIHETNEDVNLYIFTSSGNWSKDEDYTIGEYNIYRLPKLDEFDGVILDLDNIICEDVQKELIQRIEKLQIPVISIGKEASDFYYVGINNYEAMQVVIRHLHQHHGCRRFWFIMGPEGNYENEQRLKALRDYMTEQDIPFSDEDFYLENFEYQCGINGFERLYDRWRTVPEAIICGNDNIAVGVCEAAKAHGFTVPEDFFVTGFDNFDKAEYYVPQISTVEHNREEVGYCCADLLLKLWAGENLPRFHYTSAEGIFWGSCGCRRDDIALDAREHLKNQILYGIESGEFDEEVLFLEYELMQCSTVKEMMNCIPQCIPSMRCDAMYLILDDHINAFKKHPELYINQQLVDDEGFCTIGYPDSMKVSFAYEDGKVLDTEDMSIQSIFPMFDYKEGGKNFLFLPLHFRSKTVGYFVIRNAVYLMEKQYLFQIIKTLTTAIENLHKKEKLEYMNQMLSELYVRDAMTGMYNRFGYQSLAMDYFKRMHGNGKSILIMFIDLDRLKYINDNFGHEWGDFAIIRTAKTIMKYCDKEAIPARTGGDEFVLVQRSISQEELDGMIANIRHELAEISEKEKAPFCLSVSVGMTLTSPESGKSMEDYVREADEIMYQEKTAKKMARKSEKEECKRGE